MAMSDAEYERIVGELVRSGAHRRFGDEDTQRMVRKNVLGSLDSLTRDARAFPDLQRRFVDVKRRAEALTVWQATEGLMDTCHKHAMARTRRDAAGQLVIDHEPMEAELERALVAVAAEVTIAERRPA